MDAVSQRYLPRFQINAVHVRLQKAHTFEHWSQRTDDIGRVQVAGCHFVQHGCEENKVLTAHESHFDRWIGGDRLLEMQGRIQPGKTAAENHDPGVDRGLVDR